MEENSMEITTEETAAESIIEDTVAEKLEPNPHNREERYIPTEYQIIDYQRSWKKCHCGRQTWFNDNYCPRCGQRLGAPDIEE